MKKTRLPPISGIVGFLAILMLSASGCQMGQPHVEALTPDFRTPDATFRTWKNSVARLDVEGIINCYSKSAQGDLRREIATASPDELKSMQDETLGTEFKVEKIVYEGSTAYLRVTRKRGSETEVEVVNMIRESSVWKLVP